MFLVILRHLNDNLPIALFTTREAAEAYVPTVEEMPTDRMREVLDADCSTPCSVAIVEFSSGELAVTGSYRPIKMAIVRCFDEDPAP